MSQPNPKPFYQGRQRYLLIVLLWYCFYALSAQSPSLISPFIGARHAGMGGTGVTTGDVWSGFHNPAGFGFHKKPAIGMCHESRFNLQQLSTRAIVISIPVQSTTFGFSAQYFGYSNYNESKIGLAIAKILGDKIYAGLQFDYIHRYIIEQIGTISHLVVEGGIIYENNEQFRIGLHGFNPAPLLNPEIPTYLIPKYLEAGMQYTPGSNICFIAEYRFLSGANNMARLGAEYVLGQKVFLRAGVVPHYRMYTFGIGYTWKTLNIDLAFSNNQILGITPHFSMNYEKP